MSEHADYFEKWLIQNCLNLTTEHRRAARDFFTLHQEAVMEWCRDRNRCNTKIQTPSILPYSSFLWQWCAHEAQAAPPETRDQYVKILEDIKLPLSSQVQSELSDCWFTVLRFRYLPFPFE